MTPGFNFTGVHSRRKMGRLLDWLIEVLKLVFTLLFIIAGLALVIFRTTGVNPFGR